jgi:hypothetical protein
LVKKGGAGPEGACAPALERAPHSARDRRVRPDQIRRRHAHAAESIPAGNRLPHRDRADLAPPRRLDRRSR